MWWEDFQETRVVESRAAPEVEDSELYQNSMTSTDYIVNAVTGVRYPHRLGSRDMLRYYVVVGNAGKKYDYKEACRFFYATPEEFERASGLPVSAESKRRWLKNQELFK